MSWLWRNKDSDRKVLCRRATYAHKFGGHFCFTDYKGVGSGLTPMVVIMPRVYHQGGRMVLPSYRLGYQQLDYVCRSQQSLKPHRLRLSLTESILILGVMSGRKRAIPAHNHLYSGMGRNRVTYSADSAGAASTGSAGSAASAVASSFLALRTFTLAGFSALGLSALVGIVSPSFRGRA